MPAKRKRQTSSAFKFRYPVGYKDASPSKSTFLTMRASISVIIPTLNRLGHLTKCLPTICAQSLQPEEIIVVDQSDNPESKNYFEAYDTKNIKKIYVHQEKKSLILARNNGILSTGDTRFIVFLDDDLELFPDFFQKIIARFDADKNEAFAGGMGTINGFQYKAGFFQKLFLIPHHGDGRFLASGCPTFPHWKQEYAEVEFLSGGGTFYRKKILEKNMFDERLVGYGYGDDIDVSYRISRNYKMFYEPAARCNHDDHSPGRDPGLKHRKGLIQNVYYLTEKNIGLNFKSRTLFWWMVLGYIFDDFFHLRRGALIGNFVAIKNILSGTLDTVTGYRDFKKNHEI